MEFNFNRTLFFALQRLDSPGMRLKPEQIASISAVCKGKDMKDVLIWLLTAFGKLVSYETTPSQKRYRSSWIVSFKELTANQGSIAPVDSWFSSSTSHHLARGLGMSYAPPHLFRLR